MLPFSRNRREPSVIMRADRAREAGQWQIAASLYRTALDRKPGNPPIWIQYGHALKESGNRAMAEVAYRTAIGYSPRRCRRLPASRARPEAPGQDCGGGGRLSARLGAQSFLGRRGPRVARA
jgi:hypothetical protein